MVAHISHPQGELAEWKKRALLYQLRVDFPNAAEDLLEHAVNQAAARLSPGLNLMVLFTSASTLVRNSSE